MCLYVRLLAVVHIDCDRSSQRVSCRKGAEGSVEFWGWLSSQVVSVLDSGTQGPGFKSQSRRRRVAVLGKLFTPIMPLFTKQQNW